MKAALLIAMMSVGLALQGCSSVVLPTLAMLNATSPLTADPAGFEVAVDMPQGADIAAGGATFVLDMARTDTDESFSRTFTLQRRLATDGRSLFRVHPDDLGEVRALQARAIAWESEDPIASSGSFGVSVTACSVGDGPAEDAVFSVAIRTQSDGGFMPLIRNASIAEALEQIRQSDETYGQAFCD